MAWSRAMACRAAWRRRRRRLPSAQPRPQSLGVGRAERGVVWHAGHSLPRRTPSPHDVGTERRGAPRALGHRSTQREGRTMNRTGRVASTLIVILLSAALFASGFAGEARAQGKPEGEMRWALYVTLSPQWFDPAEVVGVITPFWVLYALHDALVKPLPGNLMAPSLAESWTASPDQKTYEFKLREGLKF